MRRLECVDMRKHGSSVIERYLDDIAEHLRLGRASVMVGAGFSINADEKLLTWNGLAKEFYKVTGDVKNEQKDVLSLAEEVESVTSRDRINQILESALDTQNEPSDLHRRLLELEWSDIFTTNYDSLLERTRKMVVSSRYGLVVDKEDLPVELKPRIIKLHGSFKSTEEEAKLPYVITKEDYRTYPSNGMAFINTVRQSLLENVMCLIGFSGDDPNFLEWVGWVRDQLTNHGPTIYLITINKMRSAQLKLLQRRHIKVVNLLGYNGIEENDHRRCLEVFFDYLEAKTRPTAAGICSHADSGWIVPPQSFRLTQELKLRRSFADLAQSSQGVLDISGWSCVVRQFGDCLWPLCYAGNIENKVLKCFKESKPDESNASDWFEVGLSLLGSMRFLRRESVYMSVLNRLESYERFLNPDQGFRLSVERIIHSRQALDEELKIAEDICSLDVEGVSPESLYRKASLLAEIGRIDESVGLVERALDILRKSQTDKFDRRGACVESLCLALYVILEVAKDSKDIARDLALEEIATRCGDFPRMKYLRSMECDSIGSALSIANGFGLEPSVEEKAFSVRNKFFISGFSIKGGVVPGESQYFMMLDRLAIPNRVGNVCVDRVRKERACSSGDVPFGVALDIVASSGEARMAKVFLTRECLRRLTVADVDRIANMCVRRIEFNLQKGKKEIEHLRCLVVLCGRSFCKTSRKARLALLKALSGVYRLNESWQLEKEINETIDLAISSLSESDCVEAFKLFLQYPSPTKHYDVLPNPAVMLWENRRDSSISWSHKGHLSVEIGNLRKNLQSAEGYSYTWYSEMLFVACIVEYARIPDSVKREIFPYFSNADVGNSGRCNISVVNAMKDIFRGKDYYTSFLESTKYELKANICDSKNPTRDIGFLTNAILKGVDLSESEIVPLVKGAVRNFANSILDDIPDGLLRKSNIQAEDYFKEMRCQKFLMLNIFLLNESYVGEIRQISEKLRQKRLPFLYFLWGGKGRKKVDLLALDSLRDELMSNFDLCRMDAINALNAIVDSPHDIDQGDKVLLLGSVREVCYWLPLERLAGIARCVLKIMSKEEWADLASSIEGTVLQRCQEIKFGAREFDVKVITALTPIVAQFYRKGRRDEFVMSWRSMCQKRNQFAEIRNAWREL